MATRMAVGVGVVTITEFIEARLADREPYADDDPRQDDGGRCEYLLGEHLEPGDVRRLIDSLRAILAEHQRGDDGDCTTCHHREPGWAVPVPTEWPCPTVRQVAAIDAGRPDYDETWKPA